MYYESDKRCFFREAILFRRIVLRSRSQKWASIVKPIKLVRTKTKPTESEKINDETSSSTVDALNLLLLIEYGGLELTAEAARFYTSGRARFTPPGGHILQ